MSRDGGQAFQEVGIAGIGRTSHASERDGADALGIAFAWIKASDSVKKAARSANRADGLALIEPDYEAIFELTYRFQLTSWWTIQPDVQWILHPGGSRAIEDALVLGLRSAIAF